MWAESIATNKEIVACLGTKTIKILEPLYADSMRVSAVESIEQCGPPEWIGTVHTHLPGDVSNAGKIQSILAGNWPRVYGEFSLSDRTVIRTWREWWNSIGFFCVLWGDRFMRLYCEGEL